MEKLEKSGGYKRKVKRKYQSLMGKTNIIIEQGTSCLSSEVGNSILVSGSAGEIITSEKNHDLEFENPCLENELRDLENSGSVHEIDSDDSSASENLDNFGTYCHNIDKD